MDDDLVTVAAEVPHTNGEPIPAPAGKRRRGSTKVPFAGKEKRKRGAAGEGAAKSKETVVAKKKAKAAKPKKAAAAEKGSKTEIVGRLLQRDGGCTGKEILEATGWPTVSVPAMAKACDLKLRREKSKGEPTRYFGRA